MPVKEKERKSAPVLLEIQEEGEDNPNEVEVETYRSEIQTEDHSGSPPDESAGNLNEIIKQKANNKVEIDNAILPPASQQLPVTTPNTTTRARRTCE
jgi:hypothetical protein